MTVLRTRAEEKLISSSRGAFVCMVFMGLWTIAWIYFLGLVHLMTWLSFMGTIFMFGVWIGIEGSLRKLKIYERESLERDP